MSNQNELKKRKSSSPKRKSSSTKRKSSSTKSKSISPKKGKKSGEKPQPVAFKEIAFINLTDPPQPDAAVVQNIISDKLFQQILEGLIKQFQQFLETYGGYYSRAALMEMFDITSKTTFNTWIKEKGLPYYKIDTKIVIKKSDVEEFLKGYRKIMTMLTVSLLGMPDVSEVLMMAA
jgi:excisionase family DNA binding protein